MNQVESEIERRIILLRELPIMKENGWRPNVVCEWVQTGVKIVSITIMVGRYCNKVMNVTRRSYDLQETTTKAFDHITKKLEKAYEERDTGVTGMAMD